MKHVADALRLKAVDEGFARVGIVPAQRAPGYEDFCEWLSMQFHGTMGYLETRKQAYEHPDSVLEGCQSVVMLALPYDRNPRMHPRKMEAQPHDRLQQCDAPKLESQIGAYACGEIDYHELIWEKLRRLTDDAKQLVPGSRWRGVIDTAPLLERDFARLARLGWVGKNTLLLNRELGSYFFLAALLTDLDLPSTDTPTTDHCGSCTACLDACPTEAFASPHVLNASKCISYLTIEHRGEIAHELRDQMEDWIFGCDVCQIVCPWNRKRTADVLQPLLSIDLERKTSLKHWLEMEENEFRRLYRKTPFWRTKLVGMQRNALIAAANTHRIDLLPVIEQHLNSPSLVVAETAAWAKTKIETNKHGNESLFS